MKITGKHLYFYLTQIPLLTNLSTDPVKLINDKNITTYKSRLEKIISIQIPLFVSYVAKL
jgi:hypothetical protein